MKILMLDDDRQRHQSLQRLIEHQITHATTATEALHEIHVANWDVVMLDHDLADEAPDCEETGMTFVNELEWEIKTSTTANPFIDWFIDNTQIIVHSHNSPKALDMMKVLDKIMAKSPWRIAFDAKKLGSLLGKP